MIRTRFAQNLWKYLFWVSAALVLGVLACNFPGFGGFGAGSDLAASGPGVIIQQPTSGAQIDKGESFPVFVTSNDDDGVVRIDLWVDDQIIITQSSPDDNGMTPFSLTYPMVAVKTGTYALTAQAYNSKGEMGESVIHYITVNEVAASTQELAQYIVQEGDNLGSIASKTGTTAEAIQQANPSVSNGQVKAGQQVLVPVKGASQAKVALPPPQPQKPPPQPPAPANQPTIKSIKVNTSPSPVYYGQACANEPTTSSVIVTVDPATATKSAILKYIYFGKVGTSGELSVSMTQTNNQFTADINAGMQAEQYLAQDGGWAVLWVEVLDTSGKTSLSKPSQVTIINCAKIVAPGGQAGGLAGDINQLPEGAVGILPELQIHGASQQVGSGISSQGPIPGLVVNILPQGNLLGNLLAGAVTPPGLMSASVEIDTCNITMDWADAQNETGYRIDRYMWGLPKSTPIANNLKANTTTYTDTVPRAGKYVYKVFAVQERAGKTSQASSKILSILVPPSKACPPSPKRLFFQPLTFDPYGDSTNKGFLWVTLDGFSPLRVPRAGQSYYPTGEWSGVGEWAIPLPETVLAKDGDTIKVEVQANGYTPNGPKDLRWGRNFRSYDELNQVFAAKEKWDLAAETFDFIYRMWLGDWLWGSQIPDTSLPAPYNLKLGTSDPLQHNLAWDYDSKAKPQVDGFIIYSNYSCPAGTQTSHYVITKDLTTKNPTADQKLSIPTYKQPKGCSCSYQVSAFGINGESKLSKVISKDCKTGAPEAKIQVTFEKLYMLEAGGADYYFVDQPGNIYLFADQFSRGSNSIFLETMHSYLFQGLWFGDKLSNNRFIIPASVAESKDGKGVYKFTFGFFVEPTICSIDTQVFEMDQAQVQSGEKIPFLLESSCGPVCTCKVSGFVSALKSGQVSVSKNITESCTNDSECESGLCASGLCTPSIEGQDGDACFSNDQCASGVCTCYSPDRDSLDENGEPEHPFACPPVYDPKDHSSVLGVCQGPLGWSKFANGTACNGDSVCASENCDDGLCAPEDSLARAGDYCHKDDQCYNDFCFCPTGYDGDYCAGYQNIGDTGKHGVCAQWPGSALGDSCEEDDDCESRSCDKNQCVPMDGTGLWGEYCFSSDQCLSGACTCPDGTYRLDSQPCTGYENFTPTTGGYCSP